MIRIFLFLLSFCLFSIFARADEQKKVLLNNDKSEQTIELGFCNIFAKMQAGEESGTVSIEMENLDESLVLIVFDRAYSEKAIKKQSKTLSIVFDKTFGGEKKNRTISPCSTPMEGVTLLNPSDKASLTQLTINNGETSTCSLPIYLAKWKGKKTLLLLERQVMELNIEVDLKPSAEFIATEDKYKDLEKEIGRQLFCTNPKHKTSLEKQKAPYLKKIEDAKAEIDQIIASHNWNEEDGGYIRYTALKAKLDAIDLSSREGDCRKHGKPTTNNGHSCSYCSLSLQQVYHQMDDIYKKIYSSPDRKAAKAKYINQVNALYKCCTDTGCKAHASAWKSGGEYKSKIVERYNRISGL